MIIIRSYVGVLRKYVAFKGRATLSEYWWFMLAHLSISIALLALPGRVATFNPSIPLPGWGAAFNRGEFYILELPYIVYTIGTVLPFLGLTVRRFHDAGRSGWMVLWGLIPAIGWLILLTYMVQSSEMMDNKHGPYQRRRRAVAYGRRMANDRYFFVRR